MHHEIPMPAALFLLSLGAAVVAALTHPRGSNARPFTTAAMTALVGAGFVFQQFFPAALEMFARDPAILRGEVWRLATGMFVQDGGAVGTIFNLAALIILGAVAEQHFSRSAWLAIYFGGGTLAEIAALAWQPHGAGNSVAVLALAGGLAFGAVKSFKPLSMFFALVACAAALALVLMRDIHGVGFVGGAAIASLFATASRKAGAKV